METAEILLRALLTNAYKMSDGDIDSILSESDAIVAQTALLKRDGERVATLKAPIAGQTFQDGYKKGKKESLTDFEKTLKTTYELEDSELTGTELIGAILQKQTPGKPKEITPDDVKKHAEYQALQKKLKETDDAWTEKYNKRDAEIARATTLGSVNKKALALLDSLNPVQSQNPKIAETYRNTFLKEFEGLDYEINGETIAIKKDGKLIENAHGHPITFDEYVKNTAGNYFEFSVNNGGANGGNGKQDGKQQQQQQAAKGYPAGMAKPKNFEELSAYVADGSKPIADRLQAKAAWDAENPNS